MDNMNIMDNQLNYDDPQFVTVLETCLKIEIATAKEELNTNMTELKRLKTIIRAELDKRKQLKEKSMQMDKIRAILSKTLTKSYESIREVSDNLEIMKANADDQYKLIQLQSQEYQNIVAEYKQTWHAYHAMYEKFPLAKARNAAKIKLEKLKIEYMVITFKKAEMTTIIKQKRDIDWIRTRSKIIEFATVMVERSKLKEKLRKLKVDVNYHTRKLHSIEGELQVLRKKEEDQKTLRKQKMLEMAPPKINIPYREIYAQNQMHKKDQEWKQITEFFDDNISVNTLALEELCINTISPEIIDVELEQESNPKFTAVQEENISNLESTVFSEKTNTRAASVAPDVEASAEKMVLIDDDVEMKKTHEQETQESRETVKAPSFRTKENSLKHSAPKNTQNEVEAKRIRLQSVDSRASSKITVPQQSVIVKKVDLKSPPTSFPKIRSIESVHYNVMPITPTPVQCNALARSSNVSPASRYEYCESEMSFDQMSKGLSSLCHDSLCNYKLSPTSNISSMYIDEDTRMASPPKRTLQDKKQADDRTLPFDFSNFLKKTKNDFTLF
ncbi:meiosis-specific nuclear structural protein 1-like isoform X2 [Linepithema humile]